MYYVTMTNMSSGEQYDAGKAPRVVNSFDEATALGHEWCAEAGDRVVIYDMVRVASVECPVIVNVMGHDLDDLINDPSKGA